MQLLNLLWFLYLSTKLHNYWLSPDAWSNRNRFVRCDRRSGDTAGPVEPDPWAGVWDPVEILFAFSMLLTLLSWPLAVLAISLTRRMLRHCPCQTYWCDSCVALCIYTPFDELGIEVNQSVTNKTMWFMYQNWCYPWNVLCIYAPMLILRHKFYRFWCNPRRILAFYTPYDKIGP